MRVCYDSFMGCVMLVLFACVCGVQCFMGVSGDVTVYVSTIGFGFVLFGVEGVNGVCGCAFV